MLPFTPTTGPIELGADLGQLEELGQDMPLSFTAGQLPGVYTRHAGECSVFVVAQWTGANWGRIYFNHLGGSSWTTSPNPDRFNEFSKLVDKNACYAAVLGTSRFNAVCVAQDLVDNKIPAQNISVYIAGADTIHVGFVVENGFFGEIPPYLAYQKFDSNAYGDLGPFYNGFNKF